MPTGMTENSESVETSRVGYLEEAGYEVRPEPNQGHYVVLSECGSPLQPSPDLFIDADLVTEHITKLSRQLEAEQGHPLESGEFDGQGLLEVHLEEELAASGSTPLQRLGIRRDNNGDTEFFAERSERTTPDPPVDQPGGPYLTWTAHPPDQDE